MRGAIVWAFTAYQPEAPFELVGIDGTLRSYAHARAVADAIRAGELPAEPTFPVSAKLRPLVILQDRPLGALPEYAALKLGRFDKLDAAAQERVRNQEERSLFFLRVDEAKYGLRQENAVDMNSLVRVHRSALLSRAGALDANEIDVLGRRLAEHLDVDLEPAIREGVIERMRRLAAEQQHRKG